MDVDAYLNRINYDGPREPTAETLRQLQVAHLLTVPFENLSIHAPEPIVLNDEALFQKIVVRRRGGFCYELNGLFAALLRDLGFKVEMLSAQVADEEGQFSEDFDHMTLMVTAEQRWLVDVGFGDSFIEPLSLDSRHEAKEQRNRAYRIVSVDEYLVLERAENSSEDFMAQYRFKLDPYQFEDYADRCKYHQTSPLSHFTQKRICSRLTQNGRISLSDMRFITSEMGERSERIAETHEEYEGMLSEFFGVVL